MRAFEAAISLLGTEFPSIAANSRQILHATLKLFPFSGVSFWRPKNKSTAWSSAQIDRTNAHTLFPKGRTALPETGSHWNA
jgi:hypothetical protein